MNATAITLPSIVINWCGFRCEPYFSTRSFSGRTRSSFINCVRVEFATMTDVYSAGFGVSAWFIMSRVLSRRFTVNSPAFPEQFASAVPATAWIAGKSEPKMRTELPDGPQSAASAVVPIRAVSAVAAAIFLKNMLLSLCFLGVGCALQSRILLAVVSHDSFRGLFPNPRTCLTIKQVANFCGYFD